MYSISGNIANINGSSGIYDNKINNPSIKYGRNAYLNYTSYVNDYAKESMPPLKFEYRYMPQKDGAVDKLALLGSAYEELGQKTKVKTEELTNTIQQGMGSDYSADALDINKDGYVDAGEYAASTLVQDMLSSSGGKSLNKNDVDGTINEAGMDVSMVLAKNNNRQIAEKIYTAVHNDFNLEEARQEFESKNQ